MDRRPRPNVLIFKNGIITFCNFVIIVLKINGYYYKLTCEQFRKILDKVKKETDFIEVIDNLDEGVWLVIICVKNGSFFYATWTLIASNFAQFLYKYSSLSPTGASLVAQKLS